jgi:hypothetical protein
MARERSAADLRGARPRREGLDVRTSSRGGSRAEHNERARIAQVAARLIVEHGITDWSMAKRKAARKLMLPESAALPSNDELVAALIEHHALFGGEEHVACLRSQREEGLLWMRRLAAWEPLLVGGVAAGWATAHSDVRIELVADDPKAIEIELASQGVAYSSLPPKGDDERPAGGTQLRIESARAAIRLSILTPQQRRNRPRRDDELRLSNDDVSALIEAG